MYALEIDGKLIPIDKIHFVRKESEKELLISFGVDFLKFKGSASYINDIYSQVVRRFNIINKKA